MTNSQVVNELKKMTKRAEVLTTVLKKKYNNCDSSEELTKEENDLIYNNTDFLYGVNWDSNTLDSYIEINKRMIKSLS